MIEAILVSLGVVLICLSWIIWKQHNLEKKVILYISYMVDKNDELEKNVNTLGRVMKIYEDATQILKRKKESKHLHERFTRTPR